MTHQDQYPPPEAGWTVIEMVAAALGVLWLVVSLIIVWSLPEAPADETGGAFRNVLTLLAVCMPVALIWIAAAAARSARIMRTEARRLQTSIEAMHQTFLSSQQAMASNATSVQGQINSMSVERTTTIAPAAFSSNRTVKSVRSGTPPSEQSMLALGRATEAPPPPLETDDLIRALNFPDTEVDQIGFAALRRALRDHHAKQVIQASQDVLTLLSQDGIYMDDLTPDRARPEVWRRFAAGERGRAIAALGGIRDRSCLALTGARMRDDPIFRDAAHHFMRMFDKALVRFEPEASDAEIAKMAETRTARAFMLIGRVTGTFD